MAEQKTASMGEFAKEFLSQQLFKKLPSPDKTFTGQTIIVTGSNVGMGLEAARHFVRLGAGKVILAVRNISKGQEAADSILKSEDRPGVVEVWELDLASHDSTKRFAARANKDLQRLDVVVANAGVYLYEFSLAEEDETTITVNIVSTFLMGILLLPKLRETSITHDKETVLTFTGSFVHYLTTFPESTADDIFKSLADPKSARMDDRYNVSKTIELFITRELARQLDKSGKPGNVVTSILNPGFVATTIMRHNKATVFNSIMFFWKRIAARTPEEGSRTLVFAAYGGKETHGKYLDHCTVGRVAPYIVSEHSAVVQVKLWTELSKKLETIEPGVMSLV